MGGPIIGGGSGGSKCLPSDINEKGQVVGWSDIAGDSASHAFLYSDGKLTDLETYGGSDSVAYAINDKGQVVGLYGSLGIDFGQLFLDSKGKMTDLTQLVSDLFLVDDFISPSSPIFINHVGQILGESNGHAYILKIPNK